MQEYNKLDDAVIDEDDKRYQNFVTRGGGSVAGSNVTQSVHNSDTKKGISLD